MMEAAGEGVTVIFLAMLGVLFVFWYGANLGGSKTHKNVTFYEFFHKNVTFYEFFRCPIL